MGRQGASGGVVVWTILRATAETTGAASCRRTRRLEDRRDRAVGRDRHRGGACCGSPRTWARGRSRRTCSSPSTAALSMAAAAVLLIQHSISGRSHELLSGWALAAFSVGHLALVERGVGDGALLSDRAAATYAVAQGLALGCFAVRLVLPPIEPLAGRLVVAASILASTTLLALAGTGAWRTELEELARPQPDEGILLDVCLGGLWLVVAVCAGRRRLRPSPPWSDPLTVVLSGCGLAVLAPALADITNGDPGRSHLVLTLGTSLCALVMGADALVRLLRSQHARVLASEVDRVSADQALEAERAARSELDHDLTSAAPGRRGRGARARAARAPLRCGRPARAGEGDRVRDRTSSAAAGWGPARWPERSVRDHGGHPPCHHLRPRAGRGHPDRGAARTALRRARPSPRPRSSATSSTTLGAMHKAPRCGSTPAGRASGSASGSRTVAQGSTTPTVPASSNGALGEPRVPTAEAAWACSSRRA